MRTAAANEDSVVDDGQPLALPSSPAISTKNTVIAAGLATTVYASGTDSFIWPQQATPQTATISIPANGSLTFFYAMGVWYVIAEGTVPSSDTVVSFNGRVGAVSLLSADVGGAGGALTANNLSDLSSEPTARANLGLGTAATQAVSFFAQTANNLSDLAAVATAVTNLGLSYSKGPLYATAGALYGSPPSAGAPNFEFQAGGAIVYPNAANFTLTFSTAFNNGVIICLIMPNNDGGNYDLVDNVAAPNAAAVTGQYWRNGAPLTALSGAQVQYFAIGF